MRFRSHPAPRSGFSTRFAAAPLYGALLAAAVLSACSSGSAWRSSSAMTGDHAKGKVTATAGTGSQGAAAPAPTARRETAAATSSKGASDASSAKQPQTAAAAAGSSTQSRDESAAVPTQKADRSDNIAISESGASRQLAETGAVDSAQAGATGAGASSAGSTLSGAETAAAQPQGGSPQGGSPGESTGSNATAEHGVAGRAGAGSGDSNSSLAAAQPDTPTGAAGHAAAEQNASGRAGGTQASTAALSDGTKQGAGSASHGGDAAGATNGAATAATTRGAGEGGAGLDRATGATTTANAGQTSLGASDGALSRERAGQQDGQAAKQEEVIVGLVEAPGKKATPTETVIPQTLGGLLPLTLGVEGEGEFDFDKAVLREQVRVVLDEVAGKLKSAEYDRLEIVGHTDRIGTEVYNQYLSERRAWAVARYLIQQGVPVTKVAVEGRGMHEPITAANACAGLTREATIACLQDDRRVVISASIRRVDVDVH